MAGEALLGLFSEELRFVVTAGGSFIVQVQSYSTALMSPESNVLPDSISVDEHAAVNAREDRPEI